MSAAMPSTSSPVPAACSDRETDDLDDGAVLEWSVDTAAGVLATREYEAGKRQFVLEHPESSPEQYEDLCRQLARGLGL